MTTAQGFWRESEAGSEEFAEGNMNRTLLQYDSYADLQIILDKEGMLGYDSGGRRMLTREGDVIVSLAFLNIVDFVTDLPIFSSTDYGNSWWFSIDDGVLRYVDGSGTDRIIARSLFTSVDDDIQDVTGADASKGDGSIISLVNHSHKHGEGIHTKGGDSEIDGDQIDINYSPSNYVRSTTPSEVTENQHLTAHLAGIDDVLANIDSQAITEDEVNQAIADHESFHAPSGAQVNRAIASLTEATTGSNNSKVMTPLRTKQVVSAHESGHAPDGAQVNRSIASQSEATTGSINSKVMTPLRTKQVLNAHKTGHATAGAQANRAIATQGNAETGTDNTKVMTPLRSRQAVNSLKASQAEAEAGSSSSKLMTPQRTRQAVNDRIEDLSVRTIHTGTSPNPPTSGISNTDIYFQRKS